MNKKNGIHIDGRHGEGGGQILRTALTLSALLQIPAHINHIRDTRKKPGLRPQHLMACKALARITGAQVHGMHVGSHELLFEPSVIQGGDYCFHIGTAGSTGLVLQRLIPVLLFSKTPSRIHTTGGTHVPWSPSFHYLKAVFLPALLKMGADVFLEIDTWGWYPRGGGRIIATIQGIQGLSAINLTERGKLLQFSLVSAVSNLPLNIGERQRDHSLQRVKHLGLNPRVSLVDAPSPGQGTALFLSVRFEGGIGGFTSLGKKGKPAEAVADHACNEFLLFLNSKGAVDCHLADQLVLYMALAQGHSTVITERITQHLLTNIWVIEQFLPVTFDINKDTGRVGVFGMGF